MVVGRPEPRESHQSVRRNAVLLVILIAIIALAILILLLYRGIPSTVARQWARPNIHKYTAVEIRPGNASCPDCHQGTPGQSTSAPLKDSTRDVCLGCHNEKKALLSIAGTHVPFAKGECTTCHLAHKSEITGLMRASQAEICTTCHVAQMTEQRSPYVHLPFIDGYCTSCHNPHSSAIKGLLRMLAKELCTSCHQKEITEAMAKPDIHPPFADGDCTACHAAHGSQVPWLLGGQLGNICFNSGCHKQEDSKGLGHGNHRPFLIGDCGSCHVLHSSDYPSLQRSPGTLMCQTCHRL